MARFDFKTARGPMSRNDAQSVLICGRKGVWEIKMYCSGIHHTTEHSAGGGHKAQYFFKMKRSTSR